MGPDLKAKFHQVIITLGTLMSGHFRKISHHHIKSRLLRKSFFSVERVAEAGTKLEVSETLDFVSGGCAGRIVYSQPEKLSVKRPII